MCCISGKPTLRLKGFGKPHKHFIIRGTKPVQLCNFILFNGIICQILRLNFFHRL